MGTKHILVHLAVTKCTDPPGDAAVSPYALQNLFYPFQASILNTKQKKTLQILQRPSLAISPWQTFMQILHSGGGEAVAEYFSSWAPQVTGISVGFTAIHSYPIGCHRPDKVLGQDTASFTQKTLWSHNIRYHIWTRRKVCFMQLTKKIQI